MENSIRLIEEIQSNGFKTGDKILHFGACDNDLNFLDVVKSKDMGIFYLGVDVSDKISDYVEKYENEPTYAFQQRTLQDFIDDDYHHFNYTIITGIFDKPVYEEKQYIFISTVIQKCLEFSDKVIFTMDVEKYKRDYNFSILYVINNLVNNYDRVDIKKFDKHKYIFCITFKENSYV